MFRTLLGIQSFSSPDAFPPGPKVFFSNHQSHLDTLAVLSSLPAHEKIRTRPLAAADYWSGGVKRWIAEKCFRAVLIERHHVSKDHSPVMQMREVIEAGDSLLIFPEGTRAHDDQVANFKPGMHHLAKQLPQLPFVPIHLKNFHRILPKGEFLPVPLCSIVTIGAAITLMPDEAKAAFLDRCRQALLDLDPDTALKP